MIHTLTRDSENERQRVDQIALLDMAMRFNPDIIVRWVRCGDRRRMRATGSSQNRRGRLMTTIHSMSCDATYAVWYPRASGSRI